LKHKSSRGSFLPWRDLFESSLPVLFYHITARGNARQAIYLNDEDRDSFLRVLGKVVSRFDLLLHAYCMMDNHYHALGLQSRSGFGHSQRNYKQQVTWNLRMRGPTVQSSNFCGQRTRVNQRPALLATCPRAADTAR
jgi:REP element-mobilizing transposase RayT